MPHALIHLPRHQFEAFRSDAPGFYGQVYRDLSARGWQVETAQRQSVDRVADERAADLHLVHQGLVQGPGVLNTGLSYLPEFWYADPLGINGDSSIARAPFDPETISQAWADGFLRRLRARFLDRRRSKHPQPETACNLPRDAIAVFLQGGSIPVMRTRHMDEVTMLRAVLRAADGAPVLVKAHPRNRDPETLEVVDAMAADHRNLRRVEAHVHDMIAAARVTCSLSSGASFEGLLAGVPAVLFGRTDFHACAMTVQQPDETAAALARAQATEWPFAQFPYWFLRGQMLDLRRDGWIDVLLARALGEAGTDQVS